MHAAVEASLSAAGRGPRTELQDDEDGSPHGGWDTVFLVSLLLLGLPANGLVAWLAGSQARHGAGTRLAPLLLSLALSDFLFLAAAAFQILEVQHGGHWPLGTAACRFYYFLWGVSYSSGLFLLAALSLDRCLLALCPRWYGGRRPARLPLWVCAGVWVLATLFSVPWLIFPEAAVWWYDLVICLDFWDGEELPLRVLEVLGGFLPFLLLLTCHVLTQAKACRPCCRPRPPAAPGFARVAKTVLSAYVVLRLPYQLAQLLYLAFLWDIYPGYLLWEALVYSDYLILLDSCLSPFLCLAASADLRALLRTVLSSFAAALCEERPGSFTPSEPQTHGHPEALTLPGPSTGTQPRLEPVAQPPGGPPAQPRLEPVAQPPGGPPAQPRLEPVAQPPGGPPAQPRLEPVAQPPGGPPAQPPLDPVAQPHVEPVAQPHMDSEVQPQSNTEAQTSGPIAASAPSPDDKATPTPSSDPTPGAPENPATPTTPEGESLGDAPPDEGPWPRPHMRSRKAPGPPGQWKSQRETKKPASARGRNVEDPVVNTPRGRLVPESSPGGSETRQLVSTPHPAPAHTVAPEPSEPPPSDPLGSVHPLAPRSSHLRLSPAGGRTQGELPPPLIPPPLPLPVLQPGQQGAQPKVLAEAGGFQEPKPKA